MTNASLLRVEVAQGERVRTPTGVEVAFEGAGHDDFEGGRFDDWISLQFAHGSESARRVVSLHAPHAASAVLGVCFRLVDARGERAVLELMPFETSRGR